MLQSTIYVYKVGVNSANTRCVPQLRPYQVNSQFIVRDISKSHAGGRSFFIFHSTADCSIRVK